MPCFAPAKELSPSGLKEFLRSSSASYDLPSTQPSTSMTTTLGRLLSRQVRKGWPDLHGVSAQLQTRCAFTAAVNVGATEVEIFDRCDPNVQLARTSLSLPRRLLLRIAVLCRPRKRLHRDRSAATLRADDPLQVRLVPRHGPAACPVERLWSVS